MTPVEQKIWDITQPIAQDLSLRLVRVRLSGGDHPTLQIMLEPIECSPTNRVPVLVEQCESLSRELSAVLDVNDPITTAYSLEVSSTGLERPLVSFEDFKLYTSHRAKIHVKAAIDGRRKFIGILQGVDGDDVLLQLDDMEELFHLPFADIARAQLTFTPEELNLALGMAKLKQA